MDPQQTALSSMPRVVWGCPEHGRWVTSVDTRVVKGPGCLECAKAAAQGSRVKRGLPKDEHPEIFALLHPTVNGDLAFAETVVSGSHKRLFWLCTEDKHRPAGC